MTKSNLGQKGLISLRTLCSHSSPEGSWGKKLEERTEAETIRESSYPFYFRGCFLTQAMKATCPGTTHSDQGTPTSIIYQDLSVGQSYEGIFQIKIPPPQLCLGLCLVGKKLSSIPFTNKDLSNDGLEMLS